MMRLDSDLLPLMLAVAEGTAGRRARAGVRATRSR